MFKKKGILIVFEGIEGSGKSFHIKKLYKKILKLKLPVIITREPGGSESSEKIRNLILRGKKNKFHNLTDTLLYISSRNENLRQTIIPNILKKKIVICDRFVDSTIAYQSYGLGIKRQIIEKLHKVALNNIKPDFTFLLKLKINDSIKRINKRQSKNRYDKFTKKFYTKVQKGYLKISKNNKKYFVVNTSLNSKLVEALIYKRFLKLIKR